MNALEITQLSAVAINSAFSIIAALRRMGMTTDELNARLDRVDRGEEAITVAQVRTKLGDVQAAIDAGRAME